MSRTKVTDEMIHAAQAGDSDAMWSIVSAYEPTIKGLIASIAPSASRESAEDLLQEGRAALIQHVRDYNTGSSAAQLSTYAHQGVRRAIASAWVESTTSLSVDSSTALTVKRALWQTEGDIEGAWMIVGSNEDPRRRMSREAFIATVEAIADTVSLDGPATTGRWSGEGVRGDSEVLVDTIPDPASDFTDPTERRELARFLMREIPQRQSLALRAFYGVGMSKTPDSEMAADMEIRLSALRKLRSNGVTSARKVAGQHDIAA
ncbi:sigma factor [Streptomyces scopuliridis]|uniref:Helix-turn-helix domain-containing protein n=1 Tax=Streptomyces scopuliridis TaxID=452529 RepID=A0ACD4ZTZ8_9ACTN|nr:sigma factor [Streptomyces scopuliridis]WSC01258.1 helix-turn-helix domain-containing protein [Streptomyces scopuliridis]